MRLIDAVALYERACNLEAQALGYVGKLIERDGDEPSTEWKVWSAILTERTAFKQDVFDAPTVQPERKTGKWIQKSKPMEFSTVWWYECSECGDKPPRDKYGNPDYLSNYCPNCGADMRGEG